MITAFAMILMGIVTFITATSFMGPSQKTDADAPDSPRAGLAPPYNDRRNTIVSVVMLACLISVLSGFVLLFWRGSTASPEQIQQALNKSSDPECIRLKLIEQAKKEALTRDQIAEAQSACNTGQMQDGPYGFNSSRC